MSKAAAAGDIAIDRLVIVSATGKMHDLTPQLASMVVYEDMLQPFMTCRINLKDAVDFLNKFQFIGEEFVIMDYHTPQLSAKLSMTWYVYKLDNKRRLHEREAFYQLKCISVDTTNDLNKKLTRTYKGKVSDIARQVLQTDDKGQTLGTGRELFIEETSNLTKYTSNYWSPSYNLNYLATTAVNPKGSPTYLFYENREGFHFRSIQTLYEPKKYDWKFMHGNYSREDAPGGNKDLDYQFIHDFNMPESFDYMQRLRSGMYVSQMTMYDLTTKLYHQTKHEYKTMDPMLNDTPMWIQKMGLPAAAQIYEPRYLNSMPGYGDVTNTNTVQLRMSLLEQITSSRIEITVLGKTEYTVGKFVELNIPQNAELRKDMPVEKFKDYQASGLYMIGALSHEITRQHHRTTMELIKDSYMKEFLEQQLG